MHANMRSNAGVLPGRPHLIAFMEKTGDGYRAAVVKTIRKQG